MEKTKDFCETYNYELLPTLTYNSYRTGQRSETRDYDSISVTEILGLIHDEGMDFVKAFHADKLKIACERGTRIHDGLEKYHKESILENSEVNAQFMIAKLEEDITILEAESDVSINIKGIPVITGMIDVIGTVSGKKSVIDYKTSKNKNYKSAKYFLQIAAYCKMANLDHGYILYLNNKGYDLVEVDIKKYMPVLSELLKYAESLFRKGHINNLYTIG